MTRLVLLLGLLVCASAAWAQFHGVGLGFGCFDGAGAEAIAAGGVATCVGQVDNSFDDFGDSQRLDLVNATVHHTDGTDEVFPEMFPGMQTVLTGEHRESVVLIRAKSTDAGLLIVTVGVDGIDLGTSQPFHGSWDVGLVVGPAPLAFTPSATIRHARLRWHGRHRPRLCQMPR